MHDDKTKGKNMAKIKYKVYASCSDYFCYSKIVFVDSKKYQSEDERLDFIREFLSDEISEHDIDDWIDEGGERIDLLSIERIEKI